MHRGASRNRLRGTRLNTSSSNRRDSKEQTGVSSEETQVPSSKKKSTAGRPPNSFELYVWSDEGINLHVDLNSSPSDWTNRFRNEICASENIHRKGSGNLWQDLSYLRQCCTQGENALLWNTNSGQIDYHSGHVNSSLGLELAKDDHVKELDQQPCSSMTTNVDYLKEYESTVSAEINYSVPNNYISGAESCGKDSNKNILDSDAAHTLLIKSLCCSVNSKPHNEISEHCDMLSGSMELQISEAASCHKYASHSPCENDGFLDLCDPN